MDIMSKHPLSYTSLPLIDEYIDYTTKIISKNSVINYARDTGIKLTPIHELLSKTEEFKKEFLIQTKQKIEEEYEKSF